MITSLDSFKCRKSMSVAGKTYIYFDLAEAEKNGLVGISRLPFSLKVLLENLLRHEDGRTVTADDIRALAGWLDKKSSNAEIAFRPARVLMQDFTGVPAVVDLAAMRDATKRLGGDPKQINPQVPVDLVIDHSVMVDYFGNKQAFAKNVEREYARNGERYAFLRWGQKAFDNFRVVPPGTGICHQVNLEYLAQTVWTAEQNGETIAYPDTLVGTDSHTTMVNGMAVLGWGVGGIEAEAAMLGQPVTMMIPEVIGFKLSGQLPEGATATDLVLKVVQMLRERGVVGKFVEFFGSGLSALSLEDQATIANMAPEYGATCGFFPVDNDTLTYLEITGRDIDRIALVESYTKAQGMFREDDTPDPEFTDILELDLSQIVPAISGPKRPQDWIALDKAASAFNTAIKDEFKATPQIEAAVSGQNYTLDHGAVMIAAITSCTNTSNPNVLVAAGLLARNARKKGLTVKPWVKTSLAPGSQVVADYLEKAGLQDDLDALGFNIIGFGCTTCIGNSGPLADEITQTIQDNDLVAAAVLSGNRNFEGRINPDIRANYLASPPLVVAYALAGSVKVNLDSDALGNDHNGNPVYLRDIWPQNEEITATVRAAVNREMFLKRYGNVFAGDRLWQDIQVEGGLTYDWPESSTYVQNPPYFENISNQSVPVTDIENARILGLFLDSITTDHISPAGSIAQHSPAARFLNDRQVRVEEFNSYGARRGNHQVMMRGTFANIRLKNQMLPGTEGGMSCHYPSNEEMPIYDAAMRYAEEKVPLVIFAGKEYGTGSSRDWAAKGTRLLGVRAVIAQSFERIHRSNLIGMGVLPLAFTNGMDWQSLGITGREQVSIKGLDELSARMTIEAEITFADANKKTVPLLCRIDTEDELDYFKSGGILPYVLRRLVA